MKQRLLFILLLGFALMTNAFAQERKITGRVLSADDSQPLPGVSVKIKGTTKGVLTDGDGNFSISASNGQTLVFSFIGYNEQSVAVRAGNFPAVKLITNNKLLNEVVVTDGYTTQSKKFRTGSSTVVQGVENENKPFSSPLQALQGQVPGLNVTSNSGQPGANVQVRLRGVGSIGAGSNPLYVIDGMIINAGDLSRLTTSTNVLAGINEDDIDNITVLKDASETAIYGSRGANGVIVINTKRGKAGKTQVRFDSEVGVTNVMPIPDAGKPLTAAQFRELFMEGDANSGSTPADVAADAQAYGLNGRSNDWYQLVTRKGKQQQYNVSINGGTDATRVFASAGYFKQDATIIYSSLQRFTGQFNIDHTISKKISLSNNLNFSNINQYTPVNGGAFANPTSSIWFLLPFQLAYNDDGTINSSTSGSNNFTSQYNAVFNAANDKHYSSQNRILEGLTLKWNILDKLKFTSFGSIDYNVLEEQLFNNPIMGDGQANQGQGFDYYTRFFNWLTRNQFEYRTDIIDDLRFNITAGYEAQRSQSYNITAQSNGFPATQPLLTASANAATPIAGRGTFGNYSFDSFYSLGGFTYKNRYSLTATFRRDGSSLFGITKQFGNFYSVGGAWNIDQEKFFNIQHVLSSAKLRGSYGTVGNAQGIGNYQARATAGYGANYVGKNGQNYSTVGNPDLTWEAQKKLDIGADFGFLHDRLSFSVDYYSNNIDRLIQAAPISRTTGFASITQNIGAMVNKGVEATVKGWIIKSDDFNWNTSFNVALNQNRVTSLVNHAPGVNGPFQYKEGMDFQTYYVRLYAGVNPTTGDALWYTDGTRTATTSTYSAATRVNAYQADPKVFGGFSNTFSFKGITLSADLYYNFGNMVNDSSWGYYLNDGTFALSNKYQYIYQHRWTTPGQITDVPKFDFSGGISGNSSSFSSRELYYGDYIRLKNLVIGYDFKNIDALKKLGISKLYLYGRGTNLWTKTYDKRLPFDPEQGINGTNNLDVLQGKTFTIGLNVGL
ncbi:SusC/RagA family TonB-linked outer membrane protein [Mucilaginibacter mali]|uniref:SusC/RagA family TonB-linked outer membrane protein n=1 Tax=Mucilaginibacter mali TaxID=2740462 RepID=A0A7D4UC33_9SPHI|nr:SusC/RagA family TonB-linked outer membrane protein [Mucilaginibacter mali]QKJ28919.1 SusC/RagA family TonB-linked outer membrane protein [Mucilaginibacter mali]